MLRYNTHTGKKIDSKEGPKTLEVQSTTGNDVDGAWIEVKTH